MRTKPLGSLLNRLTQQTKWLKGTVLGGHQTVHAWDCPGSACEHEASITSFNSHGHGSWSDNRHCIHSLCARQHAPPVFMQQATPFSIPVGLFTLQFHPYSSSYQSEKPARSASASDSSPGTAQASPSHDEPPKVKRHHDTPSELHGRRERLLKEGMLKSGVTSDLADEILEVWTSAGLHSSAALRSMLTQRSKKALQFFMLQLGVDLSAAAISFYVGFTLLMADLSGHAVFGPVGTPAAELAAFLLGAYFLASSLFDSATLYVLATASRHFKTDTDAFLRALQDMSKHHKHAILPATHKYRRAALSMNAVQVLAKIHDMMLKRKMPPLAEEKDLPPFLLIAATEDQTGKNLAEEYKLTRVELYELAKLFLEYDEDYDGRLTFGEFKKLCEDALDDAVTEEQERAAMELMDTKHLGYIDFEEFIGLWRFRLDARDRQKDKVKAVDGEA